MGRRVNAIIPGMVLVALVEQAKRPYPSCQILSELAIEALLARIERTSPQEGTYLRVWVQVLGWVEREDFGRVIKEDSPRSQDMAEIVVSN